VQAQTDVLIAPPVTTWAQALPGSTNANRTNPSPHSTQPAQPNAAAPAACTRPLYLTFDTGHMGVAELIADVLRRQQVRVTFFAAHEPTQVGDGSLGEHWAPWWRERAAEGHEFASHTFDHVYWQADLPGERFRQRGARQKQNPALGRCAVLPRNCAFTRPPASHHGARALAGVSRARWQDITGPVAHRTRLWFCPCGLGSSGFFGR
jgi:peptidoglycan/xylan/chitin deacetylase (PgdA/CDA1 family)